MEGGKAKRADACRNRLLAFLLEQHETRSSPAQQRTEKKLFMFITAKMILSCQKIKKMGKVTIHGLGSLGSGLWALGSWALGSLGSGLWARRPGLQSLLGSRDYWAPWAPKQESALSL